MLGVARDVKQAGIDHPTGTELYVLLDQIPRIFPAVQGGRLGSGFGDASTTIPAAAAPRASIRSWRSRASSDERSFNTAHVPARRMLKSFRNARSDRTRAVE
jgi:hypothetical protein